MGKNLGSEALSFLENRSFVPQRSTPKNVLYGSDSNLDCIHRRTYRTYHIDNLVVIVIFPDTTLNPNAGLHETART